MIAAFQVELLKFVRSRVGLIGTLAIVGGTVAILAGISQGLADGTPELVAKLGPAATLDWPGLLASTAQITAAGGLVGFGVVLAWMFGREFAEGTITGLFALPVSRTQLAIAKLSVYALWSLVISLGWVASLLSIGIARGYGMPDDIVWAGLGRQLILGLLTGGIAIPVAWITTLSRSLIGGVATTIGLVIVAQVGALSGAGGWLPLAAPALWALSLGGSATPGQLGLSVVTGLAFAAVTVATWSRLQLRR